MLFRHPHATRTELGLTVCHCTEHAGRPPSCTGCQGTEFVGTDFLCLDQLGCLQRQAEDARANPLADMLRNALQHKR